MISLGKLKWKRVWFCIFPAVRSWIIYLLVLIPVSVNYGDHIYILKLSWHLLKCVCIIPSMWKSLANVSSLFYIPSVSTPSSVQTLQHLIKVDFISCSRVFLREGQRKGTVSHYRQWYSHTQKQCNKFKVPQTKQKTHSHHSTPPGP